MLCLLYFFHFKYNDIAILTLDSPVTFSKTIRPVCLPSGESSFSQLTGVVVGWGSLRENGPQPSILQEVNLPIWTNQQCAAKYGSSAPGGIISSMICAGVAAKDSCSGDSGLIIYNLQGYYRFTKTFEILVECALLRHWRSLILVAIGLC